VGSRYKNRGIRLRYAEAASKFPHYNVLSACRKKRLVPSYEPGESVRVRATGVIAVVTEKVSWGDYVLEGLSGYYPSSALEPE